MSFQYPIVGAPGNKTQGFGENPAYYKQFGQVGHNGIDYGTPVGTAVYAMDEGTVVTEGWGQNDSWMGTPAGICVRINHYGSYGGYAHLSRTVVNAGQKVGKGQLIGYSGMTGAATGPHLHNEMLPASPNFKNGYAGRIDITPYYDKPAAPAPAPSNPSTGDDEMIDLQTLDTLYRDILHRPDGVSGDQGAIDHYVGHYTTAFVVDDLHKSPERAQRLAGEQHAIDSLNGQISDLTSQLAEARANDETDSQTVARLQEQINNLTTERDTLNGKLLAANQTIEDLQSQPAPTEPTTPTPTTNDDGAVVAFKRAWTLAVQFVKQVIGVK